MKKVGIFYGSTTGNTEIIANKIADQLNVPDQSVYNVANTDIKAIKSYDVLLLGASTWGIGELQKDWISFLELLKHQNLTGKTVAIFGTGDASTFSTSFCDAIGVIYRGLKNTGCKFCGSVDASAYSFEASEASLGHRLAGLAIDDVNEPGLTDQRVEKWAIHLREECIE